MTIDDGVWEAEDGLLKLELDAISSRLAIVLIVEEGLLELSDVAMDRRVERMKVLNLRVLLPDDPKRDVATEGEVRRGATELEVEGPVPLD